MTAFNDNPKARWKPDSPATRSHFVLNGLIIRKNTEMVVFNVCTHERTNRIACFFESGNKKSQ